MDKINHEMVIGGVALTVLIIPEEESGWLEMWAGCSQVKS